MSGIERLKKIECLASPDLAHNDPVRSMPKGGAK